MQKDNPITPPRGQRLALAACMFLVTAVFGFLQPFVPLYLEAARLTRGEIGLVTGVGTGLALLIQPLLGRLSDRLDTRRPIMFAAACMAGLAYLSYRLAGTMPALMLLTALGVNGIMYLNAAGGVLVGRMSAGTGRGGAAYASYRVWGSVGYILVALLTGWLLNRGTTPRALDRAALEPVFAYGPLLFFAIAGITLLVPDAMSRKPQPESMEPGSTRDRDEGVARPKARRHSDRNLRWFLLSFFLYQFSLYGASAYLSLFMKQLGASPLWITAMFAAGVVCEVLMMTQIGRWSDLYGRRPALAVAFLIMPLRLLLYIPARGPLWMLMVQMLHGFNFGIMGAIAVVYVNDVAKEWERGAAQARLAGVGGLATAVGPVLCGLIAQQWGMGWMFAAMSAVGVMGAVVFLVMVQESHPAAQEFARSAPAPLRPLARLLVAPPGKQSPME